MYLDHRTIRLLSEILKNVESTALLMDAKGNVLYPEGDMRQLTLPEALLREPFEPLKYGGVTLIGIRTENSKEHCSLYLCLDGDGKEVRSCARLCSELIMLTLKNAVAGAERNQALRMILRDETDSSEVESLAHIHNIPLEQERCVICIYSRNNGSEDIMSQIASMPVFEKDIWTDLSRSTVALVKTIDDENGFDCVRQCAEKLENTLTGAGMDIVIGVSDPRKHIGELSGALNEAREALNVGGIYRSGERLMIYRRLMLERFLNTVPRGAGLAYGSMVFNANTTRLFNDEMIHTIEVFFENNLNLSEAARKLYIHRNTLVYRLEKVQRITGFDLREFDDAVTFKLMMLLTRNANASRNRI